MKKLKAFFDNLSENQIIAIKVSFIVSVFLIGCVGMYFLNVLLWRCGI